MRKRLLALSLLLMTIPTTTVFASEVTEITSNQQASAEVIADIDSTFTVSIPKTITIDSSTKQATYSVSVNGDIAGTSTVTVVPTNSVTMNSVEGKDAVDATVTQSKTEWTYSELGNDTTGSIDASNISAGNWEGSLVFDIKLNE